MNKNISRLQVEDVAKRYGTSVKAIHDRTRTNTIPHIKHRGMRRILFLEGDLEAWDRGAQLEVITYQDGSRFVVPVGR